MYLEAIVGDLPTIGEKPEQWAKQREDGSWLVDASIPIYEFKDLVGIRDLPGEEESFYTTVGGFVLMQLGRIPSPAEHLESDGWRFEVVDIDGNRIDKVLVREIPILWNNSLIGKPITIATRQRTIHATKKIMSPVSLDSMLLVFLLNSI